METNDKNIDLIEKYYDGELSEVEHQAFHEKLKEKAFQEEVAFYKNTIAVLKEVGQKEQDTFLAEIDIDAIPKDIRKNLVAQNARLTTEKKSPKTAKVRTMWSIKRSLAVAASILFLVIAGTFWYAQNNFSKPALADDFYIGAENPNKLGGGASEEKTFQEGLDELNINKNLATAQKAFSAIPSTNPKYLEAQYFLGHIAAQQKNYATAIKKYQQVLNTAELPAYINRDKLNWDLLLARFAGGESIESELNHLIESGDPPFDRKAAELKNRMNSFWGRLILRL